jgi:uncharacterized protein YPO0396
MSDTTEGTGPAGAGTDAPRAETRDFDAQMEQKMREWKERWAKMRAEMETEMDELRVKAHLGKEDAKDEWDKFEARFKEIADDLDAKGDKVEDIVEEKLKAIGAELKDGFARLRKLFD